jgi:hypothetical protein
MVEDKCKKDMEDAIVLMGDPHLPGRHLSLKQKVIEDINSWPDVAFVACVGDLCATFGTVAELEFASGFFSGLQKPFFTTIGNHDNYYSDSGFVRASKEERLKKIERFRKGFCEAEIFFSFDFFGWKIIFLAVDDVESSLYSSVSSQQLDWFEQILSENSQRNTLVFCHAPLWAKDVIKLFPPAINYIVQPADRFARIIEKNSQIKLWVSGHVHFGMTKELVMHPFNFFKNQVMNLLVCDLDGFSVLDMNIKPRKHNDIWTRKLVLKPSGYECTVYDHVHGKELDELKIQVKF